MSEPKDTRREELIFCDGGIKTETPCPIRNTCASFKEEINKQKELHYAFAPYDFQKQKCPFKK